MNHSSEAIGRDAVTVRKGVGVISKTCFNHEGNVHLMKQEVEWQG